MPYGPFDHPSLEVFSSLPGDPIRDLAFEADLLSRASQGGHTLFFYSWSDPVVVLGRGQAWDDANHAFCRREGILVVRRVTGGTGVLHHRDLAVSLALPSSHPWTRSIRGLYDRFLDVIGSVLRSLGIVTERPEATFPDHHSRSPICFENIAPETLLVSGRKAVGCAQARRRDAVLVHASLVLRLDARLYAEVFGVSPDRITASITALPPVDIAILRSLLVSNFARALGLDVQQGHLP